MKDVAADFTIRDATLEDIEGITRIDEELGGLHPQLDVKVKDMINSPTSYFMIACIKDRVVGYAGGSIRDTEFGEGELIGYITHVGLATELKSKGMGSMLGEKLIERMGEKCDTFRTILSFDRIDLQSFFNHIGFIRTDYLVFEYKL
ncbi:MAG: GNAT family N-acetyltransferase [Candidatus Kariarchaeaceae archaeon]|jgi:ribosomal protein S18 acetylase RimI-like enzyme